MLSDPEIAGLVSEWFAAASRGDSTMIDRHLSTDPRSRLVGSDATEWLQGGVSIASFLRGEVTGAGGAVKFVPSDVEGYSHGEVGWAATRLTITLPDGHQVQPRWTAVMVRDGDTWKIVQTHASIAVGNEETGWSYE